MRRRWLLAASPKTPVAGTGMIVSSFTAWLLEARGGERESGLGKAQPLHQVTTAPGEDGALVFAVHPGGNQRRFQILAQPHQRADQRPLDPQALRVAEQRHVHLD